MFRPKPIKERICSMSKTLPIMFDDLDGKAQEEVLRFYGLESPVEGNFDVFPLFVLELEEEDDE